MQSCYKNKYLLIGIKLNYLYYLCKTKANNMAHDNLKKGDTVYCIRTNAKGTITGIGEKRIKVLFDNGVFEQKARWQFGHYYKKP